MQNILDKTQNGKRRLFQKVTFIKSKKPPLLIVILVMFVSVAAGYYILFKSNGNVATKPAMLNGKQISSLAHIGNCHKAMTVLEKMNPNTNQIQESIALLSYESYCYTVASNYKQALSIDKVLKTYYLRVSGSQYTEHTPQVTS